MFPDWLNFQTLWGLFLILLLVYLAHAYSTKTSQANLPPGPPAFPVIGSLPFLLGDIRKVFSRMAARYGDVFMLYMGPEKVLVLNGYNTIKDALLKTPRAFDGRSQAMFKGFIDNMGVIMSQGELWKEQRRFALQNLRNFVHGHLGNHLMEDLIKQEARHLVDTLRNANSVPVNPQPVVQKSVANGISGFIFGKRFEHDDPFFEDFMQSTTAVMEISGPNNPALLFKPLRYIPGDPFKYFKMREIKQRIERGWRPAIDDHRQRLAGGEAPTDLVGMYLQEMEKRAAEPNSTFTEYQLVHVIGDMFVAGTDTSSNTLVWLLLYMCLYPQVQARVQAEIDDVIGQGRCPCMQDRSNMSYTEAVISEVQRLCDVVPLSVPHATMEDTHFRGHFIPKDTMVLPNLHSVHWDPELWPDPGRFDPGRFLDKDGAYKKSDHLIPYSIGKRTCLGESLAKMGLFIYFTSILQSFILTVPPNHSKPTTDGVLGITYHAKDFQLIASSR